MDQDEFNRIEQEGDIDLTYRIALDDEKWMIPAIEQLAKIGTNKTIEPLTNLARARPDYTPHVAKALTTLLPQLSEDSQKRVQLEICQLIRRDNDGIYTHGILNAVAEVGTPEAEALLMSIPQHVPYLTKNVLDQIVRPGRDDLVKILKGNDSVRLNREDQITFLERIGTIAAAEATEAMTYDNYHRTHAMVALVSMGTAGLPSLERLALGNNLSLAEQAAGLVSEMQGADAKILNEWIQAVYSERLHAILDMPKSKRDRLNDEDIKNLSSKITAFRSGDLALAITLQGLLRAKSCSSSFDGVFYRMTDHEAVRDEEVIAALGKTGITEAGEIILSSIRDADTARRFLPHALDIEFTGAKSSDILDKYPEVERELIATLDRTQQKTLEAAVNLISRRPQWRDVALESLAHNPTSRNAVNISFAHGLSDVTGKIVDILSAIKTEDAAFGLAGIARSSTRHGAEWPRKIMEVLSISGQPKAGQAIGKIGTQCYLLLESIETLIDMRKRAASEADARELSDVMLPLIKRIASPAALYKDMGKMDNDKKSELARIFTKADEAEIIPVKGYFSDMFRSVVRNHDERAGQKQAHENVFAQVAATPK